MPHAPFNITLFVTTISFLFDQSDITFVEACYFQEKFGGSRLQRSGVEGYLFWAAEVPAWCLGAYYWRWGGGLVAFFITIHPFSFDCPFSHGSLGTFGPSSRVECAFFITIHTILAQDFLFCVFFSASFPHFYSFCLLMTRDFSSTFCVTSVIHLCSHKFWLNPPQFNHRSLSDLVII